MKTQAHLFGNKLRSPLFAEVDEQSQLEELRRVPSPAEPNEPLIENEEPSGTLTASSDKARKLWCEAGHF